MKQWINNAVVYHIFPLGALGADQDNDGKSAVQHRLQELHAWLPHIASLGANTLLLGPVFESGTHGYDTVDLYTVDRRLGSNEDLIHLIEDAHSRGIKVMLDAVFNHVGRSFEPFLDLKAKREQSVYQSWFHGLNLSGNNGYKDGLSYTSWNGHENLVKLNTNVPEVLEYLLGAVRVWLRDFGVDGLRLDAADSLDPEFLKQLRRYVNEIQPECWLMGEVVHGDYTRAANPEMLDSTTNYEIYKGFWSAPNEKNCFEIAYALNRQFGPEGMYRGLPMYNFVDNHDVDRISERLKKQAHLYPVHALLFTMPGVPSIYYGSESGWRGKREPHSDAPLRPALDPAAICAGPEPDLIQAIQKLAAFRAAHPALSQGSYTQIHLDHENLAFLRESGDERILVLISNAETPSTIKIRIPGQASGELHDLLDGAPPLPINAHQAEIDTLPLWLRAYAIK
jgi:cyclomaltodextrinase / maltogenic alpha-amylase / neopullulanase